ncbi:MAG: YHS domain-containing protein [Acidimicrobiales bacterium]|nr:YHS domain-containing protein [Acidimicrobiales bacterium]
MALALALALAWALPLLAGLPAPARAGGPPVLVDGAGLALEGHDPVAYFVDHKPREGHPDLAVRHQGVTYRFASMANRDAFLADPDRYLPQYGGFCAMAASEGVKYPADPRRFTVVDDRLYLNYNTAAEKAWRKDIPGHIAQADAKWPKVIDQPVQGQ